MKRIYMDYAATAPLLEEAWQAMQPYLCEVFGNPSSIHAEGRAAHAALGAARRDMQRALGAAQATEIVFTSGGSEANALAISGLTRRAENHRNKIITSAIEHPAVLDQCQALRREGFEVLVLPVNAEGVLEPDTLAAALDEQVLLLSVMMANNEIGAIQPIAALAEHAHQVGAYVHCDAVQALGALPIDVQALGVDMLSLSAHKCGGPKGVGALYLRQGLRLAPLVYGGGQERGRRGGTENLPGIVGMAAAVGRAVQRQPEEALRLAALRDRLIEGILSGIPGATLNGPREERLPGNVHVCFEGVSGQALLSRLDLEGVAASAGSACHSGTVSPSHVLAAIARCDAGAALRLSMGRKSSGEDVDYVLEVLPRLIKELQKTR